MNRWIYALLVVGILGGLVFATINLSGNRELATPVAAAPASDDAEKVLAPPVKEAEPFAPAPVVPNAIPTTADKPEKSPAMDGLVVRNCLISLIEEAQVPASEAGVVIELKAREGQAVAADAILARIDDSQPQAAKKVASLEHHYASEKATNDVDVRYSRIATKVAEAEYRKSKEASDKVKGSITEVELDRLKLAWQKAELEIEQTLKDRMLAACNADAKAAEVDLAEVNIARRIVKSPLEGIVAQVNVHRGEWVKPGDPLLRVVRIDRLRVEGFLNLQHSNPVEIEDRDVVVTVDLEHTRRVQVKGKIVFVSPLVEAGGEYRIAAELENLQERGRWVLRPGMAATMNVAAAPMLERQSP